MKKLFGAVAVACALLATTAAVAAPAQQAKDVPQAMVAKHGDKGKQGAKGKKAKATKAAKKAKVTKKAPKAATATLATSPINWGVADDASKYANDGGTWFDTQLKGASLTENRWTLAWNPSNPTAITEMPFVQRAAPVAQANGIHVVLVLYSGTNGTSSPDARDHDATAFCNWAASVATAVKGWGIHDFVVLNEPNTALYWAPQKDASGTDVAAGPVEALLAKCYDTIHAADANANVIGLGLSPRASTEKSSNDPLSFLRDVGAAYKASGRTAPIMDQLALHPYPRPDVKGSPPSSGWGTTGDAANRFAISQLDRVKQAVYDAFNGTGQPTTLNGLTFRLDEVGWQTDTTQYSQYFNTDTWPQVITEQQQSDYLKQTATQYFACDPTVTDVELFLLVDEASRDGRSADGTSVIGGGWQSGLLTAGGQGVSTPKVAYGQVGPLFAQGRAACTAGLISWSPGAAGSSGSTTQSSSGSTGSTGNAGGSTSSSSSAKAKAKAAKQARLKKAKLKKAVAACNKKFKGKANATKRATCIAAAKKKNT